MTTRPLGAVLTATGIRRAADTSLPLPTVPVLGALLVAAAGALFAQAARAQDAQVKFDIPAQPLSSALGLFASQSGQQVLFAEDTVRGKNAPAVSGPLAPRQALDRLLQGSGVEAADAGKGAYTLKPAPAPVGGALAPVVVTAESTDAKTEGTGSYTTRNLTLGKSEFALDEIPQSVSVVTRQRMDDQNMTDVRDALRQVTGVTVRVNDNPYLNNQYYARGYALSAELDGTPSTGSLNVGAPQFDLAMYDRIEVIRGSAGLLEGSGEPGGLVNFARKRPTADFQASGSVSAGSWNNYHADIDVSGPLNADHTLRGRAVIAGTDKDEFYDHSNRQSAMLYGILEYDIDPATLLSISGTVQKDDRKGIMSQLPAYTTGALLNLSPSANPFPSWTHASQNTQEGFIELNHYFHNDWRARASFRYRRTGTDAMYAGVYNGVDPATNETTNFPAADQTQFNWAAADINASGPIELFGRKHQLLVGMNYDRIDSTDNYSNVDGGSIDIFDLVDLPRPALPLTGVYKVRTEQVGIYGQGRFQLADPLTLVLGGRLSNYNQYMGLSDYGQTPQMDQAPGTVNHKLTPYAGLIYALNKTVSLYASYSDIFVPQSQLTASGSALPPRTGKQYEAGVKTSLVDGRLNASAALFRLEDRNRAYYVSDVFYYNAAGKVEMSGFETEISGSPLPGWDLSAGYTYLHPRYETEQDDISAVTPKHNFKLWSNYRFREDTPLARFNLGVGLLASSELKNGDITTPGYVTAALQVGYRFSPRTSATLTLDNLFDKTYYQSLGYYGAPRNVMLTLRSRF